MADVIRTIGPTTGESATISDAIAWGQNSANYNRATDDRLILQIVDNAEYNENITLGGFTGAPTIGKHVVLTVAPGVRHAGVFGTGHARMRGTGNAHVITITESFAVVEYLQIFQDSIFNSDECIRSEGNSDVLISRCVLQARGDIFNHDIVYFELGGSSASIDHCVLHTASRACVHISESGSGTINIDHCAMLNADQEDKGGVSTNWGTTNVRNSYAISNLPDDYQELGGSFAGSHNLSGDNTATSFFTSSTNGVSLVGADGTPNSIWVASPTVPYDLTIQGQTANTVSQNGLDTVGLEPDPRQDFSIDITGATKNLSTVSIGPFQFLVGPSGPEVDTVAPAAATTNTLLSGSTYNVAGGAGGTSWAAVYTTGAAPTHAEIKAGTNAVGSTANNPIVDAAIVDGTNTIVPEVTGLNSDTDYDLWVAVEDSGSVEATPASGPFKTANANPFITEQLNFVTVNAGQATHRMTASDADDPDVEYLVAYYPDGTGAAVTDTQLEDDCRAAPAGGGVPNPNPRGCLWARSITLTQGTQYLDTAVGLSSLATYDVESGVADATNPTVRGTAQNITMGFKTCTQALPWKNADGTDIGALSAIAWRWKDTPLGAYTDSGEIDISATGVWNANPNIEGSALADGQIGYFEAELGNRLQVYRYVVSSSPGSVN